MERFVAKLTAKREALPAAVLDLVAELGSRRAGRYAFAGVPDHAGPWAASYFRGLDSD